VSEQEKVEASIVVPCCNERAAIADQLESIKRVMDASGLGFEIIVVDDGSTDGTAEAASAGDGVTRARHVRNKGLGAARKTGTRCAAGDVVVMTDGDGTYPAGPIREMIERLREYDIVVGARRVERRRWAPLRWVAKSFIRKLAE